MTAILETIITRPSLKDVFFFEPHVDFDFIPNGVTLDAYVAERGPGFITTELETPITWEEIESRKSELYELRPDLVEMLKYKRPLEPIVDYYKISLIWVIGANGEPPFNPFSLTYTFNHHYETYDQLIADYNKNLKHRILGNKPKMIQTNNVGVERCFIDGVEVEFKGGFFEIFGK